VKLINDIIRQLTHSSAAHVHYTDWQHCNNGIITENSIRLLSSLHSLLNKAIWMGASLPLYSLSRGYMVHKKPWQHMSSLAAN